MALTFLHVAGQHAAAAESRPTSPLTASAQAGDATGPGPLAGRWRVRGVRVSPVGVAAVGRDDPSLMGAVLSIERGRLSWEPHAEGSFGDVCDGPRIASDGQIDCAHGSFGPVGIHLRVEEGRLRLEWYDGATLLLSRVGTFKAATGLRDGR